MWPSRRGAADCLGDCHAPVPNLFDQKVDGIAGKTRPSWVIIGKNDQTVQPQRLGSVRCPAEERRVNHANV
jgi:hypothetical protein